MSKYRAGNYDTGEPRFIYLKIHKHFPHYRIRRIMWICKCNNISAAIDREEAEMERYYKNNPPTHEHTTTTHETNS